MRVLWIRTPLKVNFCCSEQRKRLLQSLDLIFRFTVAFADSSRVTDQLKGKISVELTKTKNKYVRSIHLKLPFK